MKLANIVSAAESLKVAYSLRLKNGSRAFRLRTKLSELEGHIRLFEEMRADIVRATGKETVSARDPEFAGIITTLDEALSENIEIEITPLIEQGDLESAEVSARDVDCWVLLGLLTE